MAGRYLDDLGGNATDDKYRYREDRFNIGEIDVEVKNTREVYYRTADI